MTTEDTQKPKKPRAASPDTTGDDFVRLHVTPFDADLLNIIVPASARSKARYISYHTIETFPEKRYGFIELPQMEAEKIKKKLNGTTLKGSKMRIEKARPEKRIESDAAEEEIEKATKKSKSKKDSEGSERPKKRKREMGVVDGTVLGDRKVKRGWTEPADYKTRKKGKDGTKDSQNTEKDQKRKQSRSRYVDKEECLLKIQMPPNEMHNLPKDDPTAKKKKNKGSSRQVTVHEFEKTTKFMSFLRSAAPETTGKQATEFVEDKGWVDEDGNLVEMVKQKERPKPQPKKAPKREPEVAAESESEDDDTSDRDTSSDATSSESESESEEQTQETKEPDTKKTVSMDKETSSDSETSDSNSESSEDDSSEEEHQTSAPKTIRASVSKPLTIHVPPPPPTTPKGVHPLEALYKRAVPDANGATALAEKATGFSFFGGDVEQDGDGGADGDMPAVPMTPFTRQDFERRNVRSAAPTPDTVHPSRTRSFFPPADEDAGMAEADEEEEQQGYDEDGADEGSVAPEQQGASDFQKWFWENRRDLNRSWMTRRKTAAKEKRHRDNKARASKTT